MESELGINQIMNLSKGILKSTDGGASWIVLGSACLAGNVGNASSLFAGNDVNSIIVDPANSSILYLASNVGLYRSIDGGRNWTQGTGGGGNARSLDLDKTSPVGNRILYAGISGLGVKQSTDGGQSWTPILTSATPVVNTALTVSGSVGEVIVCLAPPVSPPNAAGIQVIYVCVEMCSGSIQILPTPVPIFRSTDQGANWTQVAAAGLSRGGVQTYCGYTLEMGVDPASPGDGVNDILYWGALGQFKSSNSGATFSSIDAGHADTHAAWTFARQPSGPSIVFTGNDGGIWKSTDGGATFTGTGGSPTSINEGGLQTTLFYHLDLKRDASASVTIGALQDNGDVETTGIPVWTKRVGGDGIDVAYDNGSVAYGIGNT